MGTPRRFAPSLLALVALLAGCGGAADEAARPPDQVYALEGVVVRLPSANAPRREIVLRHQAIPDFVSSEGERVGMESMTMPFAVAPDVDLAGIQPSDPVRFRFEVRWETRSLAHVTEIEKLPAGTQVDFDEGAGQLVEGTPGRDPS